MIIPCPHCGPRDSSEFHIRGEAAPVRPDYSQDISAFVDYVYGRTNAAETATEHWYHAAGCRSWLLVEREPRTHVIRSCVFVRESTI